MEYDVYMLFSHSDKGCRAQRELGNCKLSVMLVFLFHDKLNRFPANT